MNKKIGGAAFLAVGLMGTALFLRPQVSDSTENAAVVITSTETRDYQRVKDTDGDGVLDWEEELQGTNPLVKDTSPETKKKAAEPVSVPDTVTSRFAQRFFGEFLQKTGETSMTDEEKQKMLERSLVDMNMVVNDRLLTERDIVVTNAIDAETLRAYGNSLATAFINHPLKNEGELLIFKRAVESENDEELKDLDPIIATYEGTIKDVRAVVVPKSIVQEHLALLNQLQVIYATILAMRNMPTDPLPALMRFQQYLPEAEMLGQAFIGVTNNLTSQGITYDLLEPGYFLIALKNSLENI
ncbi:thrombospondin type 3 repeat-containing protein [Patescibacteria group bacterium]|nr:thrombospondin type 3 repeat-containing protein [Patescibacteria group bacterium]